LVILGQLVHHLLSLGDVVEESENLEDVEGNEAHIGIKLNDAEQSGVSVEIEILDT